MPTDLERGVMGILDRLADLHKQATRERSHYYVGSVVERAFSEIKSLQYKHDLDHKLADRWQERIQLALMYCLYEGRWTISPSERLAKVEKVLAGNEEALQAAREEQFEIARERGEGR